MAVVQISRIQQRRGKKNDGTGVPQLASAEFAWCVDTQELFIGNGSVAEGSPFVGNTKVLTEHDDLFSLVGQYQFRKNATANYVVKTGVDTNHPVSRDLETVLDQWVTAANFGVKGDGTTDDTVAIQRAIDQLYLNTFRGTGARVVLEFAPGTYVITGTIFIPSYATLVGAGREKTVFSYSGTSSMLRFINDTSTPTSRSVRTTSTKINQPKYINIKGISFKGTSNNQTGWQFDVVRDSHFEDISISGGYDPHTVVVPQTNSKAIVMTNGHDIPCERNTFRNFEINNFSYGVWSDEDIDRNRFEKIYFHDLYQGIVFGTNTNKASPGQLTGPMNTIIEDCVFWWILRHGINILAGSGNLSSKNRFTLVGNVGSSSAGARFPHISFTDSGNKSSDDKFDREDDMEVGSTYSTSPYAPLVNGPTERSTFASKTVDISYRGLVPSVAFRLPIPVTNQSSYVDGTGLIGYEINYIYKSSLAQSRYGKITIMVNVTNNLVQLVDDYEWVGPSGNDENLTFTASIIDANNDTHEDCVAVYYVNSTNPDSATMTYTYRSIS